MTYIGLSPPNTFTKSTSQTFTGNGSTTAFTLQTRVASPEDLEVFVSNVQQQPTESYTIGSDGVTMTFSEAPPSGTFYVIYRTVAQQAGTDTGASRLGENNIFTGTQTFNADVSFPDSVKAKFGTGNDLEIYHDGSNSYISEQGTGNLFILNDTLFSVRNSAGGAKKIDATTNGSVKLYFNNSPKFETTTNGVDITGQIDMNGGELILDADADTSITADTDDQIDFKTAGSDRMSIDSSGRIGIGRNPADYGQHADDLVIGGTSGNKGITIVGGDTDYSILNFNRASNTSTTPNGAIEYNHDLNQMYLKAGSSGTAHMYFMGNGEVQIPSGNIKFPTSGHGIDFSATGDGSGSMSSELLDDYEEGTWTATLISGGGITFSASERNYVKVGRLVYVNIACSFSGTSSNRVDISGLPFVSTNTSACTIFHSGGSLPTHGAFLAQSHSGHNRLSGGKGTSDMTYSDVSGTTMRITVCYLASA